MASLLGPSDGEAAGWHLLIEAMSPGSGFNTFGIRFAPVNEAAVPVPGCSETELE